MASAARNYKSHIPPHLVKSWIKSHAKMYNVSPSEEEIVKHLRPYLSMCKYNI